MRKRPLTERLWKKIKKGRNWRWLTEEAIRRAGAMVR